MLRAVFLAASVFLLALPSEASAQNVDELKARLQQLEKENASLRSENATLRNRVIALEGRGDSTKLAKGETGGKSAARVIAKSAAVPKGPKWSHWLEFGGNYSSERSRAEAGLFSPLWQSQNALVFADLRGKLFEENVSEGNFALGIRHMLPSSWNLGLWGGYDVRRSTTGNVFHQAAFGLEALHPDWDFRLNGYVPISSAKSGGSLAEVQLSGNQIFMVGGREIPLYGADFETGVKLLGDERGNELRVYSGGFWFDHKDALQKIVGPKARAELRLADVLPSIPGSRLTLEAGVRYDDVRKTDWEVGAKLRIPFGGGIEQRTRTASLTAQERRMTEALQRDTDVVSAQSKAESVQDALTGVKLDRVTYSGDHGDSVTDASSDAGSNSLVIANGTIAGPQQLQGDQTLQGGGSTIQMRGQRSGSIASFTAPGAAAVLNDPGDAANLTPGGNNTHIAGLEIIGTGVPAHLDNVGIDILFNQANIFINQVTVSDGAQAGIEFAAFNSVSILNSHIGGRGPSILFENGNTVFISGTTMHSTVGSGLNFTHNNNITLANSRFTGTFGQFAIDGGDDNVLAGAGNSAAGATFPGLCSLGLDTVGFFAFKDNGSGNAGTCP